MILSIAFNLHRHIMVSMNRLNCSIFTILAHVKQENNRFFFINFRRTDSFFLKNSPVSSGVCTEVKCKTSLFCGRSDKRGLYPLTVFTNKTNCMIIYIDAFKTEYADKDTSCSSPAAIQQNNLQMLVLPSFFPVF